MKKINHTVIHILFESLACGAAFGAFIVGFHTLPMSAADIKMKPQERETPDAAKGDPTLVKYSEVLRVPVEMEQVRGIVTDPEDRIYVCGDRAIQIMDKNGRPLSRIHLEVTPRCLAYGRDSLIYVGMPDHVEVYGTKGRRRAVWASLGEEAIVTSIASAGEEVYVADAGNKMVMRYDRGGRLLGIIGKTSETEEGAFIIRRPFFDVAAGKDGTLWIVNTGRYRLENYTSEGVFKKSWGSFSEAIEGFCGCCNPTHIAILSDGSIATSEKEIVRVKVYRPDGTLTGVVAGPDQFEEKKIGLDLAVDSLDRILVLDPTRRAVRIFKEVRGKGHD